MTGADLRAFRKSLGLSDRGLARAIGLSDTSDGSTIRKWERDAVPIPLWVATLVAMTNEVPGVRDWLRERGENPPGSGAVKAKWADIDPSLDPFARKG